MHRCMYIVGVVSKLFVLDCTYVQATFIAHGQVFKKGYVSEAFANTEIYNHMCGELRVLEMRLTHYALR